MKLDGWLADWSWDDDVVDDDGDHGYDDYERDAAAAEDDDGDREKGHKKKRHSIRTTWSPIKRPPKLAHEGVIGENKQVLAGWTLIYKEWRHSRGRR